MTFHYRDTDGGQLEVTPAIPLINGQPAVEFFIPLASLEPVRAGRVRIPLDHIEELIAGLRDTRPFADRIRRADSLWLAEASALAVRQVVSDAAPRR